MVEETMEPVQPPDPVSDAFWSEFLTKGHSMERRIRNVLRHIPASPRCLLCAAPFKGPGRPVMRVLGKQQSTQNPRLCSACFTYIADHHGGAEIDCTMLFADIRGSTTIAEGMSSTEYRRLLDRFYTVASAVVFDHEGTVDKFVGDELVAIFIPQVSGDPHAILGVAAAKELLRATGHADAEGPWVPIGAGVHTAKTWFGAVGQGPHVELTIIGDAVNVTARLASRAGPGEILVTSEAAEAAGLDPALERRSLDLKGKTLATEVVSLTVSR
jgi:adenylate cyclase